MSKRRPSRSSRRLARLLAVGSVLALAAAASVHAHKGATGIVKIRMDSMKVMGESMKSLSLMANGRRAYEQEKALEAARQLIDHARRIPEQFPEGSVKHPSEALPTIWQNWSRFEEFASELSKKAEALLVASPKSSAEAKPLINDIGGNCSGCHKAFRKKQK